MVRKAYTAAAVLAIAALSFVGCGKENVDDLNDNWTKAESDLNSKLAEVKATHADLMQKCTMMPMANSSDTAMVQEHQTMTKTLEADEKSLGEIDAKVAELKAKREDVMKTGKRADVEAAWNSAKGDYDALNAKLDAIKDNNSKFKGEMDKMAASNPMSGDTATAKMGATMGKDTLAMHGSKMGSEGTKSSGESSKMGSGSSAGASGSGTASGGASTDKKKYGKDGKPLIELNKNP